MVLKNKSLIFLTMLFSIVSITAEEQSLRKTIDAQDKLFFDAFNRCDLKTMGKMFSPELEFYHDQAGLSHYESTMAASKRNCERKLGLVRTILPETVAVHPIANFGAIHKGKHTFCHIENGKNDCGTFEFVHVWKQVEDKWQIYRVLSYDH